jgi:hypothetical protein
VTVLLSHFHALPNPYPPIPPTTHTHTHSLRSQAVQGHAFVRVLNGLGQGLTQARSPVVALTPHSSSASPPPPPPPAVGPPSLAPASGPKGKGMCGSFDFRPCASLYHPSTHRSFSHTLQRTHHTACEGACPPPTHWLALTVDQVSSGRVQCFRIVYWRGCDVLLVRWSGRWFSFYLPLQNTKM